MAAFNTMRALVAIVALTGAASASAQQPEPAALPPTGEPKLMFDREIFSYASAARRDPFRPLVGKESLGPLFDDLKLKGIIYSKEGSRSLALMQDGAKRVYRLHRGDVVGNSRVVEIRPLAVRMAVENLGMIRYEIMELRAADLNSFAQASAAQQSYQPVARPSANGRMDVSGLDSAAVTAMLDSLANERRANAAKQQNNNDQEAHR